MGKKRAETSPVAEAEDVLRQFMVAMINFETYPDSQDQRPDHVKLKGYLADLNKIQDKFCVDSKWRRKKVSTHWPSDYNLLITKAEQLSESTIRFHVVKKAGGVNFKFVIELLLIDGKWKVHRRWRIQNGKTLVEQEL